MTTHGRNSKARCVTRGIACMGSSIERSSRFRLLGSGSRVQESFPIPVRGRGITDRAGEAIEDAGDKAKEKTQR